MRAALAEREGPLRYPIGVTFVVCWAALAIGTRARLSARTIASPISRMNTSVRDAGGSLADDGQSQELAALVEHRLLDHVVCLEEKRLRNAEAEGFGSLAVDDQLELRRLLDR